MALVLSRRWLIDRYLWFISNTAWCQGLDTELVPFSYNVIVAVEDESAISAGHGVFDREAGAASITPLGECREVERTEGKSQS